MKKSIFSFKAITLVLAIAAASTFTNTSAQTGHSKEMQAKIDSMTIVLKKYAAGEAELKKNLVTFDTLDYTVFSNQEWLRLHESHSKDIKVNWPDGHFTTGIEKHIADLSAMFAYSRSECNVCLCA